MDKKLMDLFEKEFITIEEFETIEEHEEVKEIENCGNSGQHIGYTWYNVVLENEEEYSIYLD